MDWLVMGSQTCKSKTIASCSFGSGFGECFFGQSTVSKGVSSLTSSEGWSTMDCGEERMLVNASWGSRATLLRSQVWSEIEIFSYFHTTKVTLLTFRSHKIGNGKIPSAFPLPIRRRSRRDICSHCVPPILSKQK